ncbi:MAG: hypothetical protein GY822_29120 [Deltaproteobacteria bacterium]|nr:hypothetical protein [Deltaproteobacteria bacterium]
MDRPEASLFERKIRIEKTLSREVEPSTNAERLRQSRSLHTALSAVSMIETEGEIFDKNAPDASS